MTSHRQYTQRCSGNPFQSQRRMCSRYTLRPYISVEIHSIKIIHTIKRVKLFTIIVLSCVIWLRWFRCFSFIDIFEGACVCFGGFSCTCASGISIRVLLPPSLSVTLISIKRLKFWRFDVASGDFCSISDFQYSVM